MLNVVLIHANAKIIKNTTLFTLQNLKKKMDLLYFIRV